MVHQENGWLILCIACGHLEISCCKGSAFSKNVPLNEELCNYCQLDEIEKMK